MKKKLLLYCIASMLILQTAVCASSFDKVEFTPSSKTLQVSGKADKNVDAPEQTATLRVLKPGFFAEDLKDMTAEEVKNALVFVQQKTMQADGSFSFTYRPTNLTYGNHNVYVTAPDGDVLYQYVMFVDSDQNTAMLSALNGAEEKTAMLSALQTHSYLLDGIKDYDSVCEKLGEEEVIESIAGMIAGESFSNAEEIVTEALSAMVTTVVNHTQDEEEMVSVLEQYKQSIGLDEKEKKIYSELFLKDATSEKDVERAEEIAKNFLNQNYESTEKFIEDFCDTVILERLNADINYTAVMDILNSAKDYLTGFSFDKYEKLTSSQKAYVQQAVADGSKYTTISELKQVFNDAVTEAPKKKQNNNGGGGGGGSYSGGNGSGIGVPKVTVGNENAAPIGTVVVFDDLESVSWAKDAILALHEKKIVSGVGNKKFDPQGLVTREQFATMLMNAFQKLDSSATCNFSDVVPGAWYEKYIASAVAEGIVFGQSDAYFGIGQQISREDMAVMAFRAAQKYAGITEATSEEMFADETDIAAYSKAAVYTLRANGVINGKENNQFQPKNHATRAEAARIIYSLIQLGGNV